MDISNGMKSIHEYFQYVKSWVDSLAAIGQPVTVTQQLLFFYWFLFLFLPQLPPSYNGCGLTRNPRRGVGCFQSQPWQFPFSYRMPRYDAHYASFSHGLLGSVWCSIGHATCHNVFMCHIRFIASYSHFAWMYISYSSTSYPSTSLDVWYPDTGTTYHMTSHSITLLSLVP